MNLATERSRLERMINDLYVDMTPGAFDLATRIVRRPISFSSLAEDFRFWARVDRSPDDAAAFALLADECQRIAIATEEK